MTTSKATTRNQKVLEVTRNLFIEAGKNANQIKDDYLPPKLLQYVSPLLHQKALGFREIVITVIVARLSGINFDPTKNFYDCNPRSLYEQAIRNVLEEFQIPCGKSGPLNVAKNENALNKDWARGRRPETASFAAVAFIEMLKPGACSIDEIKKIGLYLAKELLKESHRLKAIPVKKVSGFSINQHCFLYSELIKRFPDGGSTPQIIICKILSTLLEVYGSGLELGGKDISISATDVTSKKPSDLWLYNKTSGEPINFYEVTVKKVDENRIKDSARSLQALGITSTSVTFLCRMPEDVKELKLDKYGALIYQNYRYDFIDIFRWIQTTLDLLGEQGRALLFADFRKYIEDFKTKENIKLGFNALVEEIQTS